MEEDIRFIERYARYKYNITEPSDFVENILTFLKEKGPTPQKTIFSFPVKDPSNWLYVTVWCVFPLSSFLLYRFVVFLGHKYPAKLKDLKGWGKFIFGAMVSWGLSSLLRDIPYDYELLSVQTLITAVVLVIGLIATGNQRLIPRIGYYLLRLVRRTK